MHTSTTWVDFKALRQKLSFRDVLTHFKIEVPIGRNQYKGKCPLPSHREGDSRPTFSADLERGISKCFGCGKQGNLLEFAAFMEGVNAEDGRAFRQVAIELEARLTGKAPESRDQAKRETPRSQPAPAPKVVAVNAPLGFELKGLQPRHPVLGDLGVSEETARFFGIGFADRGSLKGRIAIPLHDIDGRLVGYAGRSVPGSESKGPEYIFPEPRERNGVRHEFRPGLVLYNAWRRTEPQEVLVVAPEIEDVWRLHQGGVFSTVATMAPDVTPEQVALLERIVPGSGQVVLLARHDRSQAVATLMAGKLFAARFVRMAVVREGQSFVDAVREAVQ